MSFHESTSQSARHHYHDAAAQSPFCQDIFSQCTPLERKPSFLFHEKESTFSLPSCSGGDDKKKSLDRKEKVKTLPTKLKSRLSFFDKIKRNADELQLGRKMIPAQISQQEKHQMCKKKQSWKEPPNTKIIHQKILLKNYHT